mmetsp:Transcript_15735/g.21629  ORF Transcript_15735/g.21629 Transcript_15735/m.21629 type:complete len:205 (+) Transcript_15735:873-1487(+)
MEDDSWGCVSLSTFGQLVRSIRRVWSTDLLHSAVSLIVCGGGSLQSHSKRSVVDCGDSDLCCVWTFWRNRCRQIVQATERQRLGLECDVDIGHLSCSARLRVRSGQHCGVVQQLHCSTANHHHRPHGGHSMLCALPPHCRRSRCGSQHHGRVQAAFPHQQGAKRSASSAGVVQNALGTALHGRVSAVLCHLHRVALHLRIDLGS